ncbi:MAG: DUF4347 domain-containing protein [Myxococcaceae bacterium]
MKRALLVVGQYTPAEPGTEAVAKAVDPAHRVRCAGPNDLLAAVKAAVTAQGGPLTRLDIFDHGKGGLQQLGPHVLFGVPDAKTTATKMVGFDLLKSLSASLTHDAHIRLLGCETAMLAEGQRLLLDAAEAAGFQRVIYGTVDDIVANHFDADGFKQIAECPFLFSSHDAKLRLAPPHQKKLTECNWKQPTGPADDDPVMTVARLRKEHAKCPSCGRQLTAD